MLNVPRRCANSLMHSVRHSMGRRGVPHARVQCVYTSLGTRTSTRRTTTVVSSTCRTRWATVSRLGLARQHQRSANPNPTPPEPCVRSRYTAGASRLCPVPVFEARPPALVLAVNQRLQSRVAACSFNVLEAIAGIENDGNGAAESSGSDARHWAWSASMTSAQPALAPPNSLPT